MNSPDHMEDESQPPPKQQQQQPEENSQGGISSNNGGGGWRGWGFSSFVLSDLQKAAEEISRNAVAVAMNAAKSITDVEPDEVSQTQSVALVKEEEEEEDDDDAMAALVKKKKKKKDDRVEDASENSNLLLNSALDKLEKASEESLLGQGLKVLDHSVESFASGAWLALGSALKGGSTLVHKYATDLIPT